MPSRDRAKIRPADAFLPQGPSHGTGGRPSLTESVKITSRILDGAKMLFLRDGYEKTSMDSIATGLGMSKRTLYARFPSKSELFEAVAARVLERSLAALEAVELAGKPPREQLLEASRRLLSEALDSDLVALDRVVTAESRSFPGLARRIHDHGIERTVDLFAGILAGGGFVSGASPDDVRRDARLFLEFVALPPLRQAVLGLSPPRNEAEGPSLLQRRIDIFLDGVSAGFGRPET